jgi:DNA topoisomerase-1
MSNLVIVESPAKCAKIQSFLGPGFKVLASMGHIQALVKDLAVVGPKAGFEPSYEWIATKARATTAIKEAAKEAKKVFIASDSDYEGNFIGYSLLKLLKLDPKTTPRLVFTEITEKAIKNAIANPTILDMNKVQAQQARSLLDLTIGFTISPLLWKSVGPALSAGRCQIPCLRLVADKERTIADFKSTLSWVINGTFIKKEKTKAKSKPIPFSATLEDELEDEDSAQNYLENHADEVDAKVISNTVKKTTANPPPPLITSTLQQQASNLYRSAPAQTMRAAQKLYEAGHITYMRTDHAVLSEEAVAETRDYIIGVWGEEYCGSALAKAQAEAEVKPKKKPGKKKEESTDAASAGPKAQEAHEAIRPTHIQLTTLPPGEDSWSTLERNLYKLIWLRTVQSCMTAAKGEQATIRFAFTGEEADLPWKASFTRTTFPGWKATVTKETTEEVEGADPDAAPTDEVQWAFSQTLTAGMPLTYTQLQAKAHLTKPTSRYSEASLIQDLESKGIGRPSTYASLLETIQEKSYVEKRDTPAKTVEYNTYSVRPSASAPGSLEKAVEQRKVGGEKDRLYPTALGQSVLEYCVNHFGDLFDYGFTAGMEARLDAIAAGTEPWKQVLKDTWNSYKDRYEELQSDKGDGKRREFAGGIVAVNTAKGPLLLKEEKEEKEEKNESKESTVGVADEKGKKKGIKKGAKAKAAEQKATFYGWPVGYTLQTITQEAIDAFLSQKTAETTETTIGTWNDTPIVRKKGPYGLYVQCGELKVPWKEDDTEESIIERLQAKEGSTLRVAGDYTIKNGPYGIYMYCTKAPSGTKGKGKYSKPTFVSVPKDADWKNATEAELAAMYSAGVDAKKEAAKKGGWKGKKGAASGSAASGTAAKK